MRVTGEVSFDEELKARLDKTSGGIRTSLTDAERSAYIDHYRADVPALIATIAELKSSLQEVGDLADLIFEHAALCKDKGSTGYFSDTIKILYSEIINKLSRHGLSRRDRA